jgi:hypothetical protein
MIAPNKFIDYSQSIMSRLHLLLKELETPKTILELYSATSKSFSEPSEFLYAVDTLHILKAVNVDFANKLVSRAN